MVETRGPTVVRIRLPIRAPTRCVTGLALGLSMVLGTAWVWLTYPHRFADPCVPTLMVAAGIAACVAGVAWYDVDHAILVDTTKSEVLYDKRRQHSSWLNAQSIQVRQERSDRASRRPVWRVYLVKATEEADVLWEGHRQRAATRIAQSLGRHILKPWFLVDTTDSEG
jgi:hypothetical protein